MLYDGWGGSTTEDCYRTAGGDAIEKSRRDRHSQEIGSSKAEREISEDQVTSQTT